MAIKIRDVEINDVERLLELEKDNFTTDAWNKEQWIYEINENKFAHILVFTIDDILMGYIDYWVLFEFAEINKICVDKKYRKQGVASLLLQRALYLIDQENCLTTSLEVRVSNVPAIKLYEKHLFKTNQVKKQYYSDGEDCLYMIRSIGDVYEG